MAWIILDTFEALWRPLRQPVALMEVALTAAYGMAACYWDGRTSSPHGPHERQHMDAQSVLWQLLTFLLPVCCASGEMSSISNSYALPPVPHSLFYMSCMKGTYIQADKVCQTCTVQPTVCVPAAGPAVGRCQPQLPGHTLWPFRCSHVPGLQSQWGPAGIRQRRHQHHRVGCARGGWPSTFQRPQRCGD